MISISKDRKEIIIRKDGKRFRRIKFKKYGKYTIKLAKLIDRDCRKYKNYFEICGEISKIFVYTKGRYFVILIDTENLNNLLNYRWYIRNSNHTYYAKTSINGKEISMQKLIINNQSKRYVIDHIDRNGLNNMKDNLRVISISENGKNRSISSNNKLGFNGISICKNDNSIKASWYDFNNKQHFKSYSINKYGYNEAYRKALKKRYKMGLKYSYTFSKEEIDILINNKVFKHIIKIIKKK